MFFPVNMYNKQAFPDETIEAQINMKKSIFTVLLALVATAVYADNSRITHRTNGSITFVVDENLTPGPRQMDLYTGKSIAEFMLSGETPSHSGSTGNAVTVGAYQDT